MTDAPARDFRTCAILDGAVEGSDHPQVRRWRAHLLTRSGTYTDYERPAVAVDGTTGKAFPRG